MCVTGRRDIVTNLIDREGLGAGPGSGAWERDWGRDWETTATVTKTNPSK